VTLLVTIGPQLAILYAEGTLPKANVTITFTAVGYAGTLAWTLVSSDLPSEWDNALTVSGDTATLSATPALTGGTYSVTVEVVDSTRQPVRRTVPVVIFGSPVFVTGTFPSAFQTGTVVNETLPITGGSGTYSSVSVTNGELPPGLSLAIDGTNVRLTGTIGDVGYAYGFVFTVTDSLGSTGDSDAQSIEITGNTWTPLNISGGLAYLYDDLSSVTNVSGLASQWNDRSGNAWHATQGTAADRPTIVSSAINGLRALDCDGGDSMGIAGGAMGTYRNVASGWIFALHRHEITDSPAVARAICVFGDNASNVRIGLYAGLSTAGNRPSVVARRTDGETAATYSHGSAIVDSWSMNLALVDYSARTVGLWIDGEFSGETTGAFTSGGSTSNTASVRARLFAAAGVGATAQCNGKSAAIFGAAALPSTADRDRIFGWAAWRYDLTAQLPEDHPYKLGPPVVPA
jgi:hypothetical protein